MGDQIYNVTRGQRERVGRILQMHANQRQDLESVQAGDIVAIVGLKRNRNRRYSGCRKRFTYS